MTYKDANGRVRLKTAVDIKACVGVATCPFRVFAFAGGCPTGEVYCVDHDPDKHVSIICPHFWEVETIDYLPVVKCDHPQAESNLEG